MFCVTDPAAFAGRWVVSFRFVLYCSLVHSELPGVAHERHEVVVVIDVGRYCGVVVVPLLTSDNAVAVFVTEAREELHEDLLVSHLSALNFGVLAAVIDDSQVGGGNGAAAIRVEFCEGLIDDLLARRVGGTTDTVQEFIVADDAVLIHIQMVEQELCLTLSDVGTEVLHAPVELLHVDFAVAIIIEDAERTAHTADRAHTTCVQAGANLLENCTHTTNQSPEGLRLGC